jgi:transposase
VIAGVDTHKDTHHAAVITSTGQVLADHQFPATSTGYHALTAWLTQFGTVIKAGVEGTGSYGAGLARHLTAAGIEVTEVNRPDRRARRANGKSDPLDALAAARAVLAGTATAIPKTRTGPAEAIRILRLTRTSAVKARTAAINTLHALITTAPEPLRATLAGLRGTALIRACTTLKTPEHHPTEPHTATTTALTALAARITYLTTEIRQADAQLATVVAAAAPHTSAIYGAGPDTAGQLITTAGDNPHRITTDAALARLCGTAPIPASSGRTHRHRLHRGGDRQANKAIHTIALTRMRHDPATRAYVTRRTQQGLTKRDIIRCLKRYITREIHTALLADLTP